jgi:hypothetical protein
MGIDPETLRLVAQFINHYATPGPIIEMVNILLKNVCSLQVEATWGLMLSAKRE